MNVSTVVLAITTLGLGSASVYLYTELDAAKERAGAEAALRQDQENRVRTLEAKRLELERQLQALSNGGTSSDGRVALADTKGAPSQQKTEDSDEAMNDRDVRRMFRGARNSVRDMLATPEGRKNMLAQNKMGLRMMHKDMASVLKLSPADADRLLDLMAEQQIKRMEEFRDNRGDPTAMQAANSELERANEADLMALLGEKYPKYEEYQQTLGERMQVEQLGNQFAAANIPLADNQRQKLMTAMVEERKVSPQPEWSQSQSPEDNMASQRKWRESYDQRVRERVSSVLSSDQMKQYEEMQKAQSGMFGGMMGFATGTMRGGPGGRVMQFAVPGAAVRMEQRTQPQP